MSDKIDWLREAVEAVENVVRERDSRIRQLDQRAGELQALVAVYAEYVALLESSLADLHGTHGYRPPAAAVRRGAELRQRIEELSSAPPIWMRRRRSRASFAAASAWNSRNERCAGDRFEH
jgi:hypothetical protein